MAKLSKMEQAQKFLGELLNDTGDWSCTDRQHDLRDEFEKILGKYLPDWLKDDEE
jgi:hypothetical protein